uniref:RING-type domain-containing protein n=1 Tax=Anopheles epiroticus TaxID=199890 RepID=A0A182P3D3_9DIPT
MTLIDDELSEVSRLCENVIPNSTLVTCLRSLVVRVEILQSPERRLTVCLRFPENYPANKLLLEFKSKTLPSIFLEKFEKICETKLSDAVGKPQIMWALKLISEYLSQNPLCIVLDELQQIKSVLSSSDELKIRQRTCTAELIVRADDYIYGAKFKVPSTYPLDRITWEDCECNLPQSLMLFINGTAHEIARRCVEPPLRRTNNSESFTPKPSLYRTLSFLITTMRAIPNETCPICAERCLPKNPLNIVTSSNDDAFLVRMFCGHIYHQICLKRYMSEPPFPKEGKTCPAKKMPNNRLPLESTVCQSKQTTSEPTLEAVCGMRVTHDKWGLNNVKSAETKWARHQAKIRELEEVIDFLQ